MKRIHSQLERIGCIFVLLGLFISFDSHSQTHPPVQKIPLVLTEHFPYATPANMSIHGFTNPQTAINLYNGNKNMSFGFTGWMPLGLSGIGFRGGGGGDTGYAGALVVAVNTTAKNIITVQWTYRLFSQNSYRDNSMILQYRVGTTGLFTNLDRSTYSSAGQPTGDSLICKIVLPPICNNKPLIQLRWFYWHSAGNSGSQDVIAIDDLYIKEGLGSITVVTEVPLFKFQQGDQAEAKELVFKMEGTESKVQIAIAPDFELSTDQFTFSSTLEIPPSLTETLVSIWVRPSISQTIGTHSETLYFTISGTELARLSLHSQVIAPPPTHYPSGLGYTSEISLLGQDLALHWTHPADGVLPSSYLLVVNEPGFIPEDGVDYAQSHIVLSSTDSQYLIAEPIVGASYHICIFPYTNIGRDILYKRDGDIPTLSITLDPIIGGKTLPYTIDGLQEVMSQSSFDVLWVAGITSSYTAGLLTIVDTDAATGDIRGVPLEIDYPDAPISTHIIPNTSLLICLSWDKEQAVCKGLSVVFHGVVETISDGDWSDRDIWQPGVPAADNEVVLSHAITLSVSTKVAVVRLIPSASLRIAPSGILETKGVVLERSGHTIAPIYNEGTMVRPHVSIEQEIEQLGVWYFVSLPFDLYWDGVVGFNHADDPTLSTPDSYYLRYYDGPGRSAQQSDQDVWKPVPVDRDSGRATMKANVGYLMLVNEAAHTSKLRFTSRDSTQLLDHNISLPLTAQASTVGEASIHDGWNLVANPFLTPYSLSPYTDKDFTGAFAYWYDGVTYRVVEMGLVGEPLIPPLSPFFVRAERSDMWELSSVESQSIEVSAPIPEMKLTISQDQWSDQLVIRLNPLSTNGYDPRLDAAKLLTIHPTAPQIFTQNQGKNWAIHSQPMEGLSQDILLKCLLPRKGLYTIKVSLVHADHLEGVYWQVNGKRIDLTRTSEFTINAEAPFTTYEAQLVVVNTALDTLTLPKDANLLYIEKRQLYIYLPKEGATLSIFDLTGRLMMQQAYLKGLSKSPLAFAVGPYIFELKQGKRSKTTKMTLL